MQEMGEYLKFPLLLLIVLFSFASAYGFYLNFETCCCFLHLFYLRLNMELIQMMSTYNVEKIIKVPTQQKHV